ncbi:hypothetical protein PUV44_02405 [Xanthomonas arboricola pv. corylina]|nr:hypothetical protein PUV44_02405 [Xanthomonas arboricola pv. corylina]
MSAPRTMAGKSCATVSTTSATILTLRVSEAGAEPDLDANEPVLRSSDIKRLNRKALVFLAAIAALLILVIFWLATQSGEDSPRRNSVRRRWLRQRCRRT